MRSNVMVRFFMMVCLILTILFCNAQGELRIGDWRSYLPYRFGWSVTQSPTAVYYGTQWSLLKIDKDDLSMQFFSKVEGLSDIGIQLVEYAAKESALIVIYQNSNIDLIFDDEIINLPQIKSNTQIVKDRTILDVFVSSPYAYLATGFGLVQLNLEQLEFGFTTFTDVPVRSVSRHKGQLYIGTEEGLFTAIDDGSLNLADFSRWKKIGFEEGLPQDFQTFALEEIDGTLYAGIDDALYANNGDRFSLLHREKDFHVGYVEKSSADLLTGWICDRGCNHKKIIISADNSKKQLNHGCLKKSFDAVADEQGRIWYAEENAGFKYTTSLEGECITIRTNRPGTHNASQIAVHDRRMYIATGGVTPNYGYLFRTDGFLTNADDTWISINKFNSPELAAKDMRDFLSIIVSPDGTVYVGTFWDGLIEYNNGEVQVFDRNNSSLQNSVINPDRNRITDLEFDSEGNLWMLNHDAPRPISVMTTTGDWFNYSVPTSTNLEQLAIDQQGYKWIGIGGVGVLVFDSGESLENTEEDRFAIFNSNNSEVTVNAINDITVDLAGEVWVGTTAGPVKFTCGNFVFDGTCNGLRPIVVENGIAGELLGEENVQSIAVDGGNRKWFGTNNGIFVQSPDIETQIDRFTTGNCPLFDNGIIDIAVDQIDGEVFIATNRGILSVRGEATEGGKFHQTKVYAFPNPVRPEYSGPIAIKGLAENANVKITDIQGNIVYETVAIGGQAIWNGKDFEGRKPASGVYLVFSTAVENLINPDAAVAKIMFIH
ncbi:MAG: hypothetical protein OEQ53_10975 [Saprospiraceae bacterium]|nr:hypothetical protein [Saprospiraceae bacterium]